MRNYYLLLFFSIFINEAFSNEFSEKIKPILNNRCVACHSCFSSPCQLNLQSYSGFLRGASKDVVYDGTRLKSVAPTRLDIDASTTQEWRKLHFFSIHQGDQKSILYNILRTDNLLLRDLPAQNVDESSSCIDDPTTLKNIFTISQDLKMPYALPTLSERELTNLKNWIIKGSPGNDDIPKIDDQTHIQINEWEQYLNQNSPKQKLVSRYLYEHLFLAHIYFNQNENQFYRLIRSSQICQLGPLEIATRRPNEFPGTEKFYYCLKPLTLTVVAKSHMPFLFSKKVLDETKSLFESISWNINTNYSIRDSYSNNIAENPFLAFNDIPASIRYKFLLNNAHFMISTFIKGPVCNGSIALNSIQEQFYVLFLRPEAGFLTSRYSLSENLNDLLTLPGVWGSDVELINSWKLTKELVTKREVYRKKRSEWFNLAHPKGHAINDIWDGEGQNDNAALTVFRHDDNAVVVKGLKGDLSKTVFVLDYSLFERLVYNLVVNFDIYGNVGHQLLTRMYMDYLRMEAEENYLLFFTPENRLALRKEWYKGVFTDLTMSYIFPLIIKDHPVNIKYNDTANPQKEFIERIFYDYFPPKVRGNEDLINWKNILVKSDLTSLNLIEKELRKISSLKAIGRRRFPTFFPETSYLIINKKDKTHEVYSIIKNREHENISWILGESLRLDPENNTLTILKGFSAFYPNYFFEVDEEQLSTFTDKILKLSYDYEYLELKKSFGVSRVSDRFWTIYDLLNQEFKNSNPIEFGYLDLSRYLKE